MKVPFVKKGYWIEQTIEGFIHDEQSFFEKWYEALLPEELDDKSNL